MALIPKVNVYFYSWTISREITKSENVSSFFLLISFLERIKKKMDWRLQALFF